MTLPLFPNSEQTPFIPSENYKRYIRASKDEKRSLLERILKTYKLSASHLNRYKDCRKAFLYVCFLKARSLPSSAMLRGTMVHHMLDWIFKYHKEHKLFPEEIELEREFHSVFLSEIDKNRFNPNELDANEILTLVKDYVESQSEKWNMIALTEFHVQQLQWNKIRMTGLIDKIEFYGKNVNLVDYKTGNIFYALSSLKPGGSYYNQLLFYAVLIEQLKPDWNVQFVEMAMVSKTEQNSFLSKKIQVTDQNKAELKELIIETHDNISSFKFEGCNKDNCYWCNHYQ